MDLNNIYKIFVHFPILSGTHLALCDRYLNQEPIWQESELIKLEIDHYKTRLITFECK